MIKPLALVGVLLAATPVFAQESADAGLARMDEFVAVFAAHNCVLATKGENAIPEDDLMALFAHAGFSESDVGRFATALLESEQATVERETDAVTILPPLCDAGVAE